MTDWVHNKHTGFRNGIITAVGALALLLPGPGMAGNSQYSRVRHISPQGAVLDTTGAGKPLTDNASSRAVFDIVVSLHFKTSDANYPSGDNDADVNAGTSDDEQNAYEDIIRFFADGVCESTNGAHHLGEVRIFKRGKMASSADIIWKPSEWPQANPSGFGVNGKTILFGDIFPFTDGATPPNPIPYDALSQGNREGSGYTLAHEWGHYTLGLYDEYEGANNTGGHSSPRLSDRVPPFPAIMNNQWSAANAGQSDRFRFLNFSQKDNSSIKTAQGRVYKKSAWEIIGQSTDLDPKDAKKTADGAKGRVHYTTLDGKAPPPTPANQANPNYSIQLPAGQAACRTDLEIIWMQDDIELVLAVDTSTSMNFNLADAKASAKLLVDLVPEDHTAMGMVHFATNVSTDMAVTPITEPPGAGAATRNQLKTAIDGFNATGSTAFFDGAQQALQLLEDYLAANLTKAFRMVIVLSDGDDTNSKNFTDIQVVNDYQGAVVSLSAIGYGEAVATIRGMSLATNGFYYQSPGGFDTPATMADVHKAFVKMLAQTTHFQALKLKNIFTGTGFPGSPGINATLPLPVDSTVESLNLVVTFNRNDTTDIVLGLNTPSGALANPFDCVSGGGETACRLFVDAATLDASGTGDWTFTAQNNTGSDVVFDFLTLSTPKPGESFEVTVDASGINELSYPGPVPVTAAISKGGRAITGVDIEALHTFANRTSESFIMNDQGTDGDAVPGDGIYTALVNYAGGQFSIAQGAHTFEVTASNPNNNAVFTDTGFSPAHGYPFFSAPHTIGETGGIFSATSTPVGENFVRTGLTQIELLDFDNDNHGDNTGAATALLDDNVPIKGRIDSAGDLDVFQIASPDTSRDLSVRVFNMALGMTPKVTVLDSAAVNELASGTVATSQSQNGYISLTIPKENLPGGIFIIVEHTDPSATLGNFEISAGGAIEGDTITPAPVLVSAILPSSRSVQTQQTVTIFMTILNATDNPAFDIGVALKTLGLPIADFSYQITSPLTNAPIGNKDTPAFLDGLQGQTYLVSFRPFNTIAPVNVEIDASSFNAAPITPIRGVNTLQLRASTTPVTDLIALAATLNNDGFVNIPGTSATGVFAAATSNLGLGGLVTVKANTGDAVLPLTISICQTDVVGACMAPPASLVDVNIDNGATPTFGVFVAGAGNIANNAATNRVFLEFFDAADVLVGSTSVAVKTVASP